MAGKYQIIARYTDGKPKYWIGRKTDLSIPLLEDNVEWKTENGMPLVFEEYKDAWNAMQA